MIERTRIRRAIAEMVPCVLTIYDQTLEISEKQKVYNPWIVGGG